MVVMDMQINPSMKASKLLGLFWMENWSGTATVKQWEKLFQHNLNVLFYLFQNKLIL